MLTIKNLKGICKHFMSTSMAFLPYFILYNNLLGHKNNANYIYLAYDCSIFFICIEIAVIVLRITKHSIFVRLHFI